MLVRTLIASALIAAGSASTAAAAARDPIVPLADVHRGMACTARTVVQGTEITTFGVEVLDVVRDVDGFGPRILVRVSGAAVAGTGIASGFSGSPVYCADRNGAIGNAGAISATIGQYGNDVGLVTPIEQMLGLPLRPPSAARTATRAERATARPVAVPVVVSGLSPALGRIAERSGRTAGRTVVAAPSGPAIPFGPQELVPGASMAVAYASGALALSAVGTVTYRDGAAIYGFGHQLDGAGRRSLPLHDAYVYTVVGNPLDVGEITSYKLAAPGRALGVISNDARAAVVGTVGGKAPAIPLVVTVRDLDLGQTLRQRTEVADEVDVGDPVGDRPLTMVAPLAVAQAVTSLFDGAPARESGRLCLRVTLRETRKPLRFCNRHVVSESEMGVPGLALAFAGDVATAVTAIEKARFARLHVVDVRATVSFERGLRLATIRDVVGPRTVRRGARVPIKLRVREFRGPLRTIAMTVTIPRDAPLGERRLRLRGTAIGSADVEWLFGSGGAARGAQRMSEIRDAFARAARYDGVHARIGGVTWEAGADPGMRIDGRGALDIRVVPR